MSSTMCSCIGYLDTRDGITTWHVDVGDPACLAHEQR